MRKSCTPLTVDRPPFARTSAIAVHSTTIRHFWASCCSRSWFRPVLSPPLLQQRLRLLEVSGVKALREPGIYRGQDLVRLGSLTLLLPQPTQAQRGAQLQRAGLLTAGHVQGLVEEGSGLGDIGA